MTKQPKEITVRVLRSFYLGGEPVAVDTVLTLDAPTALEVIAYNKAVATDEKPRSPRKAADVAKKPEAKPQKPDVPPAGDKQ